MYDGVYKFLYEIAMASREQTGALTKVFQPEPFTLATGQSITIPASGMGFITLIPDSKATVSYSKVDSATASAHDNQTKKSTNKEIELTVNWAYYHISVTGGPVRICLT